METPATRLLLASTNRKKLAELEAIMAQLGSGPLELLLPADIGGLREVVEDGTTFEANAILKAKSGAVRSGLPCLADDSGLEVEALDGAPGVHSARYAGAAANDWANMEKLLDEMRGVEDSERGARFVCVLALALPDGSLAGTFRGTVNGRIGHAPRGSNGFGYDPLFLLEEGPEALHGRTFAELDSTQKAAVSHRGRALHALARELPRLLERSST